VTTSFGRLVRTASRLRPSQVAWRFVHEARLRLNGIRPPQRSWFEGEARFAVSAPDVLRSANSGRLRHMADLWRRGDVQYLAISRDRRDWVAEGRPRLWRYERHYH